MPTYDYACTKCGHVFEKFHAINFHNDVHCPLCNEVARKKISAGTGLIFKGSGFYITDYKGGSQEKKISDSKSRSNS